MSSEQTKNQPFDHDVLSVLPSVRRFLAYKLKDRQDVDDLVQETMLRTLRAEQRRLIQSPISYAITTAKSVLCDFWRNNRVVTQELDGELDVPSRSMDEHQIDRQKVEIVAEIVDKMPALRREVFIRRRLEGHSREEIANDLGLSVEAVKKHINRGLMDLTVGMKRY